MCETIGGDNVLTFSGINCLKIEGRKYFFQPGPWNVGYCAAYKVPFENVVFGMEKDRLLYLL